mmetsp:Transcript_20947/g.83474  ORF Transcript_20947/g.83474 Transcript_20947/m.83474 type:complete len:215 (+) Transcript_20947:264-908(+)
MGAKPCLSRKALLPKLMKSCVVRVLGPAVAKTSVPREFDTATGSSRRLPYFLASPGSAGRPNCTMKLGRTRKKRAPSKNPVDTSSSTRATPSGAHSGSSSTTIAPSDVSNEMVFFGGAAVAGGGASTVAAAAPAVMRPIAFRETTSRRAPSSSSARIVTNPSVLGRRWTVLGSRGTCTLVNAVATVIAAATHDQRMVHVDDRAVPAQERRRRRR